MDRRRGSGPVVGVWEGGWKTKAITTPSAVCTFIFQLSLTS